MALKIRYQVPYEVAFHARDAGSGKPLTNIVYFRTQFQTIAAPAYGEFIAGASDIATLRGAVNGAWADNILPVLNHNYTMVDTTTRAIIGKRYGTPVQPISVLIPGAPIAIVAATPHGLVTGDKVAVGLVTIPVAAVGYWTVTVSDPFTFTLNGSAAAGGWSGDGVWQHATGPATFVYQDKDVWSWNTPGGIAGDSLPLFCSASIRRTSTGVGRNFRSRLSMSPMSESDSVDGGFTVGRRAAINAGFAAFLAAVIDNGGSDATSKLMVHLAVSKKLAMTQPVIFTSYFSWTAAVTNYICQPNCGSIVRRKPKLTSAIG